MLYDFRKFQVTQNEVFSLCIEIYTYIQGGCVVIACQLNRLSCGVEKTND